MKGIFSPLALNTPEIVYQDTATTKTSYTLYINVSNLLSGRTLAISIKTSATATDLQYVYDEVVFADLDQGQQGIVSIPFILESGDIFTVTLDQTTGSLTTFPWGVISVQY